MTRATIAGGAFVSLLVLLAVVVVYRYAERDVDGSLEREDVDPVAATSPRIASSEGTAVSVSEASSSPEATSEAHQGFLYGRATTEDGATYEGRLRFGGDQEAFWDHYFNGFKDENPWAAHLPPERSKERVPIEIFGLRIAHRERQADLGRPFMARFGDIARIEARGVDVRVTLKSGTVHELDRLNASDFDDGLRVWDSGRGLVDLDSGVEDLHRRRVDTIALLSTGALGDAPRRLHGTVRTPRGDFAGFIQLNGKGCVGTDELDGRAADGELHLRFDTLRSVSRRSRDRSLVTLLNGREIELSDLRGARHSGSGIYVSDRRYGRVLISWDAFERVDFSPSDSGPAYGDFPPGRPLTGTVTTRAGRRLAGRLVFDLDESETTDTLDARHEGVDYTILFGLIASIVPPGGEERQVQPARVTLHSGEDLQLERTGDLGEGNAGMLIFADGVERPEYVPWSGIARIDLDRPPAKYP